MKSELIDRVKAKARHPFRGLATVFLSTCAFLLLLVLVAALVHWALS